MLFKPDFCCHCGEKIERIEWKIWTSRKFCENCEAVFRNVEWTTRAGLILSLIGGLLGFGTYLKTPASPRETAAPRLAGSANRTQPQNRNEFAGPVNNLNRAPNAANVSVNAANRQPPFNRSFNAQNASIRPAAKAVTPQTTEESAFYCGAQTKKGSSCTRKVKGGGRCWQHLGQPSMPGQDKLAATP